MYDGMYDGVNEDICPEIVFASAGSKHLSVMGGPVIIRFLCPCFFLIPCDFSIK